MEKRNDNAEKVVGIFEKSIDAEKGFENASENADKVSLKNYFRQKSHQRSLFVNDLKLELLKQDNSLSKASGSVTGDLHRTWMDIKTFFSSNNDEAMLLESIRGEKAALKEFHEVLDEEYLTLELRNILAKQYEIIKKDYETIKTLEDIESLFS